MIRGLSPIPRGGGKPEGKEGSVLPRSGRFARSRVLGFALNSCVACLDPTDAYLLPTWGRGLTRTLFERGFLGVPKKYRRRSRGHFFFGRAPSLLAARKLCAHLCKSPLHPGIQLPPPAGSPKNHSPRRGPTILGGTFGARVRATSLPRRSPRQIMPLAAMRPARRANSGRAAAYFESPARHSQSRRLLRLALRISARRV